MAKLQISGKRNFASICNVKSMFDIEITCNLFFTLTVVVFSRKTEER